MTTLPERPTELRAAFRAELRTLIHAQPTPELRASTIYNIVRECYDTVRAIHGADTETPERSSLGLVSDAAVRHEETMYRLAAGPGLEGRPRTCSTRTRDIGPKPGAGVAGGRAVHGVQLGSSRGV